MKCMNKKTILINIIGMVIARAVVFQMNPIAIGFFAASFIEKQTRAVILISILVGIATSMPLLDAAKYGLIMAVTAFVIKLAEGKKKKTSILAAGAIAGIVTMAITLTQGAMQMTLRSDITYSILIALLEGFVVFAFTEIFHKGITYILYGKIGQALNNEQIISIAIMAAAFIYAVPDLPNIELSLVEACAFFIIILLGYKYGSGAGAITGAACGIVLTLQDSLTVLGESSDMVSFNIIGILCILGILSGMVREVGKFATAIVFLVSALALGFLYEPYLMAVEQVRALVSGVVLFVLFPRKLVSKIDVGVQEDREELFVKQSMQDVAREKLKEFSESFKKLSSTFHTISDTKAGLSRYDINQIFDELSDKVCKSCENCNACWKSNFYDTYKAAFSMLNSAERNGFIQEKDVPVSFAERCINLENFIIETNRGLELAKINLNWHNRMAESREAIAGQLCEVANIISDFSMDLYETVEIEDTKESLILSKLTANHLEVKKISIMEKRSRKQEIYVIARTKKGRCVTTREAASLISDAFGKRMRPADGVKNIISKDYDTFIFVEDTIFKTLTGMARMTKSNEKVSGDNFSFIHLANGEMIMTLSDGMGSGVKACEESESVIELLEQFMEAGFKEDSAIKLINSILVLKSEEHSFSTIDMSILNLYTGICEFVKIGASTTFIKRDNWVETISSTTLPIGVFNQVDFDGVSKKLYDGDFVIMVTDGVLDCIHDEDKEKFLETLIMESDSNNPQEIANYILDKAIEQNDYTALDDMTILVSGIWKK